MKSKLIEQQNAFQDYQSRYPEIVRWDMFTKPTSISSTSLSTKEDVDSVVHFSTPMFPDYNSLLHEYVSQDIVNELARKINLIINKKCSEIMDREERCDASIDEFVQKMHQIKGD